MGDRGTTRVTRGPYPVPIIHLRDYDVTCTITVNLTRVDEYGIVPADPALWTEGHLRLALDMGLCTVQIAGAVVRS